MQGYDQTIDLIHPGDLEPQRTRNDEDRYNAVVTGWIQEQDLQDLMENSLQGPGPWRSLLRTGILHQELPEDQLEMFAQAAFRAARNLAGWLAKHRKSQPQHSTPVTSPKDDLEQGRNNALEYAAHLIQRRAPCLRRTTLDWPEEAAEEWTRQALQRETDAARTGDHQHFLQTLRDLRQESINPETPGRYARDLENRSRQMDEFIRSRIEE